MKKLPILILTLVISMGCGRQEPEEMIGNLGGYWEIKSVRDSIGKIREYQMSSYIDYIETEGGKGFRKKVSPKISGGYLVTENMETFTIKIENDSINLYYTTPYDSWKESLISSEENEIKFLNPQGLIYTYKRFTPYLKSNGKKE